MVFYVRFQADLCLQFSIGMAWGGTDIIQVRQESMPGVHTAVTIQVNSWAIIEVRHGALGQIW